MFNKLMMSEADRVGSWEPSMLFCWWWSDCSGMFNWLMKPERETGSLDVVAIPGSWSEFLVEVGTCFKSEMVNTAEKLWRDDRE